LDHWPDLERLLLAEFSFGIKSTLHLLEKLGERDSSRLEALSLLTWDFNHIPKLQPLRNLGMLSLHFGKMEIRKSQLAELAEFVNRSSLTELYVSGGDVCLPSVHEGDADTR
jgi:hypothetical protein